MTKTATATLTGPAPTADDKPTGAGTAQAWKPMSTEEYERRSKALTEEYDRRGSKLPPGPPHESDLLDDWLERASDMLDAAYRRRTAPDAADCDILDAAIAMAEIDGSNDEIGEIETVLGR